MIYDKIENIDKYYGINKNFDFVIEWLKKNKITDLKEGKTHLYGENVFVNVMYADTKYDTDTKYEVHNKYADLQIDLTGCENYYLGDIDNKYIADKDSDISFFDSRIYLQGRLDTAHFVLFLPFELHKPTLVEKNSKNIKKIVFKILW